MNPQRSRRSGHSVSWLAEPTYRFAIRLGITLFTLMRIRFRVRGTETFPKDGPVLVAITHFGYADFALTERCLWKSNRRLMRFMATAGSFRHRISGPLMRGMHHIPVERSAGESSVPLALEVLQRGEVVGIFPEAGVSTSWQVKTLKTGTVRIAAAAGVPLVPVGVWGGHRIITRGHGFSLKRAFGVRVHLEFGEPIHYAPDVNVPEATKQLHATMAALVEKAREGYPVPSGERPWWMPALDPSSSVEDQG